MLLDLSQETITLSMPQMLEELNNAAAKGELAERELILDFLKCISVHPSMNKRFEWIIKAIERGEHGNCR